MPGTLTRSTVRKTTLKAVSAVQPTPKPVPASRSRLPDPQDESPRSITRFDQGRVTGKVTKPQAPRALLPDSVDVMAKGEGAKQMMPEIVGVLPSVWDRLGAAQREDVTFLMREQAEYIHHPSFLLKNAEDIFFGPQSPDFSNLPTTVVKTDLDGLSATRFVLSAAQERALFLKFNYARYRLYSVLERYKGRKLNLEGVQELLLWYRRTQDTRAQITQANVPLVLAMAKRKPISNVDFADLVSEGNLALLRSVDKFDASRGFKFSTYSCRAILKAFSRVAVKTTQYRGRFPTEFDPALEKSDHVDRKRDELESDCTSELRTILNMNKAGLTDVEQTVMNARFSLEQPVGDEPSQSMTLEEVGRLIGVTKERVRQIQKKAMAKIRFVLEEGVLR